jgi:hypothetical protein
MEVTMQLLQIKDKIINWDLVTDIKVHERRDGMRTMSIYFGTHFIRLNSNETRGFEKWLKRNQQIEEIEPQAPPTYMTPDRILKEKEKE